MNQVKGKKKGKKATRWILTAVILLTCIVGAVLAVQGTGGVSVETAEVTLGSVAKTVDETGSIAAKDAAKLTGKNSGIVKSVAVEEGQAVKKGTVLMVVDEALSGEDNSTQAAQLEIRSMEAELEGVRAQYDQAKALADKNRELYETGAVSQEQYLESDTAAKTLAAKVSALEYSISSYRVSSAEKTHLVSILAPIDGIVTGVYTSVGETVVPGGQLAEVTNLSDLYVKTDLMSEDADLIQVGSNAVVENKDSGFRDEHAVVRKIYSKAEEKLSDLGVLQKRVTVEVALSQSVSVRLGSSVEVEITAERKDQVLFVPEEALFEIDQKDAVYAVRDGIAVLQIVETGLEGEDDVEIRSGLKAGEGVILSPEEEISDGTKIKAEPKETK